MSLPRPIRSSILASVVLLLVSACASEPMLPAAQSFEGRDEKSVFAVLRNVEATDPQRDTILASYDKYNPTLLKLATEWRDLRKQWEHLDRTDPGFAAAAETLATRRGEVASEQIRLAANFEHDVAAALTPQQWKDWQELWSLVGDPHEMCGGGPSGGMRHRRR